MKNLLLLSSFVLCCYLWGGDYSKIIAKIENPGYDSVLHALLDSGVSVSSLQNKAGRALEDILNEALRGAPSLPYLSQSQLTTYTYLPQIVVDRITSPRGKAWFTNMTNTIVWNMLLILMAILSSHMSMNTGSEF